MNEVVQEAGRYIGVLKSNLEQELKDLDMQIVMIEDMKEHLEKLLSWVNHREY